MLVREYYLLDLKNDPSLIEEYKVWHTCEKVPADVTASIRAKGIQDLEIFLAGNRMMMTVTRDTLHKSGEPDPAHIKAEADWETLMWRFQQGLPFSPPGEKWVKMTQIYSIN